MFVRDKVLHFYLTNDEVDENILDSVHNIVSSDLNSRKTVAIFDYFSSIVNDFMSFCPFLNQAQEEKDEEEEGDEEEQEEHQECTHEATRRKLLDAFFVSKKQNASMFVKQYCESELIEESLAQRSLSTSAFLRPLLKLGFQLLPFYSIQKQEDDIEQTLKDINDITEKLSKDVETECKRFKDQCETFYQELDNQQERNLCKEMEDLLKSNKEEQLEQEYVESTQ